MKSSNPFSPGNPVNPRFFVGRETILEAIRKILETEKLSLVTDVEILGRRGLGKTSALLKIRSMPPQNYLTAYLPGRNYTELEFIGDLQLVVERKFRSRFDKPISFVHLFEAFKLGQESGTSAIIKTVLEVKDSNVLIILDDADQVPPECLIMLKAAVYQLRSNHSIRAAIVFASRESIFEKLKKAGLSPSESLATQFQLKNFNYTEVTQLLKINYPKWTDKSINIVYNKTKGLPLLVQMYGSAYYDLAESDEIFKLLPNSPTIQIKDNPDRVDWGKTILDAGQMVKFAHSSERIARECDSPVKEALWQWYRKGPKGEPTPAEWKAAIIIAKLGSSARFVEIKKRYGRNPGPQLERAVEKGLIEKRGRGLYAIPHPIIARIIAEKYGAKSQC